MVQYKRCFGQTVIKGQFVRKDRARAWAHRFFGANAKEGYDFELVQTGEGKWAAEPGSKYDAPCAERGWETAMGMRGYAGSPAQAEDIRERNARMGRDAQGYDTVIGATRRSVRKAGG